MHRSILILFFVFLLLFFGKANAQQGIGTNTPNKSAALEVASTKRGLLIPRVALQGTTDVTTIHEPTNSLLVYNTEATGAIGFKVTPGYYYYSTTTAQWHRLLMDLDEAGIEPWFKQKTNGKATENTDNIYQTGNVAIGKNTGFLTNAVFEVGINNESNESINALTILNNGMVGLGKDISVPADDQLIPTETLDVLSGNVRIRKLHAAEEQIDRTVVVDPTGVLKSVVSASLEAEYALPKYFYMPSVLVPVDESEIIDLNATNDATVDEYFSYAAEGTFTVNLYKMYKDQFSGLKANSVSSEGSNIIDRINKPSLPILTDDKLIYHITWYDARVFEEVAVSATGVLTYKVKANAPITFGSFMNIVFEVR